MDRRPRAAVRHPGRAVAGRNLFRGVVMFKFLGPYRWAIGGGIVILLIVSFLYYRHSLIAQGRAEVRAEVAKAVQEQKALADAQTRNLQEVANEAQEQYLKDVAEAKAAADRIAADLRRLRSKAASADKLAAASREALAEYAAEAERDIDWCAGRLEGTGTTASQASAAAYRLYDGWPAYKEFQSKLTAFQDQLKGKP